jgi:DNA-binding transcriptional regulator YiaG
MTPAQLKKARHALGLSAEGFARLVGVKSGRTVRRWESGEREIPGPVIKLLSFIRRPSSSAPAPRLAPDHRPIPNC